MDSAEVEPTVLQLPGVIAMSSDSPTSSSVNAQEVEQTKRQIRGLVEEIAALSKKRVSADEYYPEFLNRVVEALAAVGGAVWTIGEGNQLHMGRETLEEALILGDEVLIGQTVLEKLDLWIDCMNQKLVPNPAHPDQPVTKVKSAGDS